jgi:carotenoid cleavage dioxygenase
MSTAPDALAFHLRGNFAPVADEATLTDLNVEGELPRELSGFYVRNGPNPQFGASPHASRFGAPPIARVRIPRRVPFGFHGSWIAGAEESAR